jgi:hypothetical protein
MRALLLMLSLLLGSDAVFAQSMNSGNARLPGCRSVITNQSTQDPNSLMSQGICAGEMTALISVSPFLQKGYAFCKPENATVAQAIQIVLKATDNAPERNHTDLVVLAIDALAQAWPCK